MRHITGVPVSLSRQFRHESGTRLRHSAWWKGKPSESMRLVHSPAPAGTPSQCHAGREEFARFEWRLADGGDPAALVEEFCIAAGLPAADLTRPGEHRTDRPLCGVALLVSASAGAVMIGGEPGPSSPIPAVPDLVAVAYRHAAEATTVARDDDAVKLNEDRKSVV